MLHWEKKHWSGGQYSPTKENWNEKQQQQKPSFATHCCANTKYLTVVWHSYESLWEQLHTPETSHNINTTEHKDLTCNANDSPLCWIQNISRGWLGAFDAMVFGQVPGQRVSRRGGITDWAQVTGGLLWCSPDQRSPPGLVLQLFHCLDWRKTSTLTILLKNRTRFWYFNPNWKYRCPIKT